MNQGNSYLYLVGGLISEKLTPESEQAKLNQCGEDGWKLVQVLPKRFRGKEYVFYYFIRINTGETPLQKNRLIFDFAT
jgi:hypothetical protein